MLLSDNDELLYTIYQIRYNMSRGYLAQDIRARLIKILSGSESDSAMSGAEIAKKMGMSRTTVSKYLIILAADGTLTRKDMGNITLWSLQKSQKSYKFPDDYHRAAAAYMECIRNASEKRAQSTIHNCTSSGATAERIILEVVMPASDSIYEMYEKGKIGSAEQNYLGSIVSRSLYAIEHKYNTVEKTQRPEEGGVIVIAADRRSIPVAAAACSIYRTSRWAVYDLGYVSSSDAAASGVLFDLDFQKITDRISGSIQGPLITVVFSSTAEGLNFFADSIYPVIKASKKMHLLLCGCNTRQKIPHMTSCDHFINDDISKVIQISQTISLQTGA